MFILFRATENGCQSQVGNFSLPSASQRHTMSTVSSSMLMDITCLIFLFSINQISITSAVLCFYFFPPSFCFWHRPNGPPFFARLAFITCIFRCEWATAARVNGGGKADGEDECKNHAQRAWVRVAGVHGGRGWTRLLEEPLGEWLRALCAFLIVCVGAVDSVKR